MSLLNKINIAALNWERTRDPKYKKEWYALIRRWSESIRKKPKQISDYKWPLLKFKSKIIELHNKFELLIGQHVINLF